MVLHGPYFGPGSVRRRTGSVLRGSSRIRSGHSPGGRSRPRPIQRPGWTFAPTLPPSAAASGAPSAAPSAAASGAPSAAPSGRPAVSPAVPFQIKFTNNDAGIPQNVAIHKDSPTGQEVWQGEIFSGTDTRTYDVPAFPDGTYGFARTVHPNMMGTLTVK